MGVVPRVQSKPSRALHTHRGKKFGQDLQTQESTTMKRAMVRVRGTREKGTMSFVEGLGVSQENPIEAPLWRATLGRSLGSHEAAELVSGMCHGNSVRQETTRSTPYLAQRRDEALSFTIACSIKHWLDPFERVKFSLLLKIRCPSERKLADKTAA